jgi:hypothetical protein
MTDIKQWIDQHIIVGRFPKTEDFANKYKDINVVINVSDEFYLGNAEYIVKFGKQNFYLPMSERHSDIGLTSMFGALHILYEIYQYNPAWHILLHCQAGKNRSPTVKSAFYYMMTVEHEPDQVDTAGTLIRNNRLLDNCERNKLPALAKTEAFLTSCKFAFDNSHSFIGGMLDWIISESGVYAK